MRCAIFKMMHKIIFIVLAFSSVDQFFLVCSNEHSIDDKIKFVDHIDEKELIREKIRTEMDEYKRLKEMSIKSRIEKTTTSTTTMTSTIRQIHLIGSEDLEEYSTDDPEEITTYKPEIKDLNIFDAPIKCKTGQKYANGRCRDIV